MLTLSVLARAQNHSYTILNDQVYPLLRDSYEAAKNVYTDLSRMYAIDPGERVQFSQVALDNGDVEFYKTETQDLIQQFGYFFRYEDTLKSPAFTALLNQHALVDWLVAQTNERFPVWVKENPDAFFVQQKLMSMRETNRTRIYYNQLMDYHTANNDSAGYAEVLKYARDFDFTQLYEIVKICKVSGLPTNFDAGYASYYILQYILINNTEDQFNFERTWHHIFPFLEKAYFDGKISNTFTRIYDEALEKHYNYQYFGTIDSVEVKDPEHLAERRKKYGL